MGIPSDFPVRPLRPEDPARDRVTCGHCGRSWDDAIATSYTPAPSARCPFEYFHDDQDQDQDRALASRFLQLCNAGATSDDAASREFWRRLAGSVRKALTML